MAKSSWVRRRRSGQALVEFALITPILLMIVMGIVEFGRAWNAYQTITNATREATRQAVVADPLITQDSVRRVVNNTLWRAGLDSTRATKQILGTWHGAGSTGVRVEYAYHMGWLQPVMSWTTGQSSVMLKSEMVMRSEW